ncbi:MAG: TRAM domain-containing protein, partial [Methanosarcinaceae archaeon]|nr:TRAM domain-containing protein [Methanosarcinaceae archaeon]
KVDKYTIFVPRTKKGDVVKIKVKRISGNLAFADLV